MVTKQRYSWQRKLDLRRRFFCWIHLNSATKQMLWNNSHQALERLCAEERKGEKRSAGPRCCALVRRGGGLWLLAAQLCLYSDAGVSHGESSHRLVREWRGFTGHAGVPHTDQPRSVASASWARQMINFTEPRTGTCPPAIHADCAACQFAPTLGEVWGCGVVRSLAYLRGTFRFRLWSETHIYICNIFIRSSTSLEQKHA